MPTDTPTRAETKTIRLLLPIRVGKEIIPNNAVLDADTAVADELIGHDPSCAEETDAVERYPTIQRLAHVDDYPVTGAEKFPLPEGHVSLVAPAAYENDVDRTARLQARAAGPVLTGAGKPLTVPTGDQPKAPESNPR